MRKTILLFSFLLLISCDENQFLDLSGELISKKITVPFFDKINISEGIELHIRDEAETKVEIVAGTNVIDKVTFLVLKNQLFIDASTATQLFQSYEPVKIYLSIDQLVSLYSSSQFNIYSENILNFSHLNLQSGLFDDTASGEFHLQVNCTSLVVEDNRAGFYKIEGNVNNLTVAFYNGNERFDGSNLIAQNVFIFQRSSNDISVNPQQQITGTIYSTGNVILFNNPPVIDVQVLYQGQLIYH